MRRTLHFLFPILFFVLIIFPKPNNAADASVDLKDANKIVNDAYQMAEMGEYEQSKSYFDSFNSTWIQIEDGIKNKSKVAYKDIEDTMGQVLFAFAQQPINKEKLLEALHLLDQVNEKFIKGEYSAEILNIENTSITKSNNNVSTLVSLLDDSLTKIKNHDLQGAKVEIETFRQKWLDIEGVILTQSAKVYKDAEQDMVMAYAYLSSNPPEIDKATKTIQAMRNYLKPLSGKTSYSLFDATTILLREGLEALLIIVALLGFLKKSGHEDKKNWIWAGIGSGVVVSIILGVIVQLLFSSGAFGKNNFLIAGWTGIFAAVMLLYMSYWLHSKSSIAHWQQYIRNKSTKALATGSLLSLAFLSFLAVFREGTEIVLFLIGMASSINIGSLIGGILLGIVILLILAYLILKAGLKIPLRPFFMISSIFVFYLCFKFTGMGVHGLQLAGFLPATHISNVASIDFLSIYPTFEGVIPQALLILFAIFMLIWNKRRELQLQNQ